MESVSQYIIYKNTIGKIWSHDYFNLCSDFRRWTKVLRGWNNM